MKNIKDIAREAEKALDKIKNGKTFPANYVVQKLEAALQQNPKDALIGHMRDVLSKRASDNAYFTQREIAETYDHLYGMSGGNSRFREFVGDLLPDSHASISSSKFTAQDSRIPYEKSLDPMYKESELSKELSGAFSLNKKGSFSAFSDNTIKKAEKFAKLQLVSMGCNPQTVNSVKSNEHFILCTASVDTSDFTQVEIPVPVQVTNGIPSLPSHFIQDGKLVKLNKENLYVFVKDKNNYKKKASRDSFANQRAFGEIKTDSAVVPAALDAYANIEDTLVEAASSFSKNQINIARNVVASQMAGFGIPNPQIKVFASNEKTLTFSSDIPTEKGRMIVEIPVDMPNGVPVIPNKFKFASETYPLNESGLRKIIESAGSRTNSVSRRVEAMSKLSYAQLIDRIASSVDSGDLKVAEEALGVIEGKFGGQKHITALDMFSKLLKHSSGGTEREAHIKKAVERGDLIRVPTSVQLYCPKLGLPVSKIAFNHKGEPVPASRKIKTNSLEDQGAMISSSKVVLS